jgi:hypothetical protein
MANYRSRSGKGANRTMNLDLPTTGRSTLLDKTGFLAGFGNGPHPIKRGWYVCLSLYRMTDGWVLCSSEGKGTSDPGLDAKGLGGMPLTMALMAPYAERFIDVRFPYAELRKIFDDGRMTWRWMGDGVLAGAVHRLMRVQNFGAN